MLVYVWIKRDFVVYVIWEGLACRWRRHSQWYSRTHTHTDASLQSKQLRLCPFRSNDVTIPLFLELPIGFQISTLGCISGLSFGRITILEWIHTQMLRSKTICLQRQYFKASWAHFFGLNTKAAPHTVCPSPKNKPIMHCDDLSEINPRWQKKYIK